MLRGQGLPSRAGGVKALQQRRRPGKDPGSQELAPRGRLRDGPKDTHSLPLGTAEALPGRGTQQD